MSKKVADALRQAIRDSGESANQIAKATGVEQTSISRFLRGKDMGIERASKIAEYLGMELTHKHALRRRG
jgi:transcriptional regulator with XRE-family HTH domain